jgi:imidazolonepropionase-like amidohydrolase
MAKTTTLDFAMSKARSLPEAAQEQLGREVLLRVETLDGLRAAIELGVRQLDAGEGRELDMEEIIADAHREYGRA